LLSPPSEEEVPVDWQDSQLYQFVVNRHLFERTSKAISNIPKQAQEEVKRSAQDEEKHKEAMEQRKVKMDQIRKDKEQ
jgi:hypothetical protein